MNEVIHTPTRNESRNSIGAVFMISTDLKNILENLDATQIYNYVLHNDEMTLMIDDMMDMEFRWYDVMLMLNMCEKTSFFSGKIISDSIKKYGCIALIKSTETVKGTLRDMLMVTKNDMKKAYNKLKCGMLDSFENDWDFFTKLKRFYLKVIALNRCAFLFC